MPALNINDLNNGKKDLDHIGEIATSEAETATDRLGRIKLTVRGAINSLKAFNVRGAFVGGTPYATKDVYISDGVAYVALIDHVASTVDADLAAGKVSVHQGATREDLIAFFGSSLIGFIQSAFGAIARTVQDKLRDTVNPKDFGAKCDGVTDDLAAAQACINASVGSTVVITGVLAISAPLEVKNGVNIRCEGTIKALPGFVGAQLVITDAAAIYDRGTLSKLRLNGNGLNIKGLVVRSAQSSFINHLYVYGCLNDAIHVQSGYEVFINEWQVFGSAAGMTANAAGLRATAGDCHYSNGIATLYPIGVAAEGGNCRFTRIHPWGVYTAGSTPMLHGFLITGEGNTFTDCSPDSPDLANRAIAASKANGGYGFYIDAGAINTKFNGCRLIVASHANAPVAKLYCAYVGAAFCGFVSCTIDDNSGAALVAGYMQYVSSTTQRTTEHFGGVLSTGKLWMNGLYSTFIPELRFGGVEISTLGGTYFAGRRSGYAFRIGPMMYFAIHIRLTAKGTATGAVTVGGLPLQYVDLGNSQAWPLNGQMVNPFKNVMARIYVASSELRLYDAISGNQLTDADIGINQEIHISGMYPVATAP